MLRDKLINLSSLKVKEPSQKFILRGFFNSKSFIIYLAKIQVQ